ncbi:hypothetical protein P3X46_022644 [Hevea brasiliensis]|uniref:Tetraspanin-15 n=1 Tax=Hevea brasiliensis TaxID=3981 RepID=A0ABQ9L9I8_HEVBR|nr:tetraspanin-15-like [Hevea brasiliensis]KAJ9162907.1 hypothetical protein P3X46_022644 [Hevea brasiliensis]
MAENNNPDPNPNPTTEVVAITVTEENSKPKEVAERKITDKVTKVRKYAGLLSIISFILSLLILASVIWLLYMKDYDCEKHLRLPNLQIGLAILMIFVFLISNIVVFFRSRFPIPGFLIVMVPLIVIFTMGLAIVGADKMESRRIMATPVWFREKVRDEDHWRNIKSCIYNRGLCEDLASRSLNLKAYDFRMKKLSSVESGCCNPPIICEMEYVNATFWKKDEGISEKSEVEVGDCETWNNDRSILCYDCESCKEGFVGIMEKKWWNLGIFLILMALFLILAHISLFIAVMWEHYSE